MVHLVLLCLVERGKTIEDIAKSAELPVEAVEEAIHLSAAAIRDYLSLPDPDPETVIEDRMSSSTGEHV